MKLAENRNLGLSPKNAICLRLRTWESCGAAKKVLQAEEFVKGVGNVLSETWPNKEASTKAELDDRMETLRTLQD